MSAFAALALYPLWAIAAVVGLTALRLGRASGSGLPALCLSLAMWVTGLILLVTPQTTFCPPACCSPPRSFTRAPT